MIELRGPYRMFTKGMTQDEARAWFKEQAKHDYEERNIRGDGDPYFSNRSASRMSIRTIEKHIEPRKRKEVYKGETVLGEWYCQGSIARGKY